MKVLNQIILCAILLLSLVTNAKISQSEYIDTWKEVAVQQMLEQGIPASITMAQGILESGYGNSTLAVKANNHFGIKCHSDWKGKKVYHDDDKKGECFRKYPSAIESFADHSIFLTSKSRYEDLFKLKRTDYKGWAKGLRKAGYATNPKYPDLLIDLIERLDLDKLDKRGSYELVKDPLPMVANAELKKEDKKAGKQKNKKAKKEKPIVQIKTNYNSHQINVSEDKLKYIVAKKGDTYYRIAKEFSLNIRQLYRYNDVDNKAEVIEIGSRIYLMPKRKRSKKEDKVEITENNVTLRSLSQDKGIKLKALLEYNRINAPDELLAKGKTVFLRKY